MEIEKIIELLKKYWKHLLGITLIAILKELNFNSYILDTIAWFLFWICLFVFFEWKDWIEFKRRF